MMQKAILVGGVMAMIMGGIFLFRSSPLPRIEEGVPKKTESVESSKDFKEVLNKELNRENSIVQKQTDSQNQKREVYINPIIQARRERELLMEKRKQELSPYLEAKKSYSEAKRRWMSSLFEKLESTPIGTPQYGEAYINYTKQVRTLSELEREFERAVRLGDTQEAKKISSQIKAILGVEPPMPPVKKAEQKTRNGQTL